MNASIAFAALALAGFLGWLASADWPARWRKVGGAAFALAALAVAAFSANQSWSPQVAALLGVAALGLVGAAGLNVVFGKAGEHQAPADSPRRDLDRRERRSAARHARSRQEEFDDENGEEWDEEDVEIGDPFGEAPPEFEDDVPPTPGDYRPGGSFRSSRGARHAVRRLRYPRGIRARGRRGPGPGRYR